MLTVSMCTHNGSDTIGRCLEALCDVTAPEGGWRLVLVDNASADTTPQIIQGFADRLPMTMVREPRLGLAIAQNTGINHAEGDLVIFTDDDVLPEPDWLCEWRRVADKYPDIELFGGTIEAAFDAPPPPFIVATSWLAMLYAITDQTLPEGPVTAEAGTIFGPNMAARASLLARGCRFDDRLVVGLMALLGNETDFVRRALTLGARLGFAPGARLRHIVHRSQGTRRWILRRFYRHGRTMYFFDVAIAGRRPRRLVFGVPRYLFGRLLAQAARLPLTFFRGGARHRWVCMRQIAYDLGTIHEARLLATQTTNTNVPSHHDT